MFFVSGLRERWAVGKEECVSGIEKRVIFGGARVYQDLGRLNQILIQMHYGTYVHIRSSGEGRRRKCRNETLENLYQKALCRGVLRGYREDRLAEQARGAEAA